MNIGTLPLKTMFVIAVAVASAHGVVIDTIPIGHPGNPADPSLDMQGGCCFGTVDYKYRIAYFEVTQNQYAEFLNAVAASDPYELYHPEMGTNLRSGIIRNGIEGNYTYEVKDNFDNKPINWVSFWDAARFANWVNNGQPTGVQDSSTTEDGAYFLGGVTYPDNDSVTRKPGARWFLPSEAEWYKAAYFDPRTEDQGGPPNDDHYWFYATSSDTLPTPALATPEGDVANPGPNVANFYVSAVWNRMVGNLTTVGSAGDDSTSFYGTFDQSGNVWELNDTIVKRSGDRNFRGNRGGNWDDQPRLMGSNWRGVAGIEDCGGRWQCFSASVGFRLAKQFSPLDLDGSDLVDAADIDLLSQQVLAYTLNTAYDLNEDGSVNSDDRVEWVETLMNTYFGDSDLDGKFNSSDIVSVLSAGQYEDQIDTNSSWATGDWDGDGDFTSSDLVLVFRAGGFEAGPRSSAAAVPEPAAAIMLAFAGLFIPIYRRISAV